MSNTQRDSLAKFASKNGLYIKPWAKKAGVSESTVRNFLKGRTASLTHSTLEKLAAVYGISVGQMLGEVSPNASPDGFVAIRHLEVSRTAGGGYSINPEPEGKPFFFEKKWLETEFSVPDHKLRIIRTDGDSMVPTLRCGDLLLTQTDLKDKDFDPGHIYVLWDGRGLIVKRLETVLGAQLRLRVISDNASVYPPYEIDAESVNIVGRVIWRAGHI